MPSLMVATTIPAHPSQRRYRRVVWRQRYDGFLTVAYRSGYAIAGISGPWTDRYVLTWWPHPAAAQSIELYDSIEAAKDAVLQRMHDHCADCSVEIPAVPQGSRALPKRSTWLARLRAMFAPAPSRSLMLATRQMRQRLAGSDVDLSGLHFNAYG